VARANGVDGDELAALERKLESARERVERIARTQLKRSTRGALKDATTNLAGSLVEDEQVVYMAAGGQRDSRRLIAATDRRLMILDSADSELRALPYDQVQSAEVGRRGTLELRTAVGEITVESVVGDVAALVQHVNQQIWEVLHPPR
jgi:hypothetical protein